MKENRQIKESPASEKPFGAAELAMALLACALVISVALLGHAYL